MRRHTQRKRVVPSLISKWEAWAGEKQNNQAGRAIHAAYTEGFEAQLRGKSLDTCPYTQETFAEAWDKGWLVSSHAYPYRTSGELSELEERTLADIVGGTLGQG